MNTVSITRRAVALAISAHVATLRRTVSTQAKRRSRAAEQTNAANAAITVAVEQAQDASRAETLVMREASATVTAAREEARQLGVTL